MLIGVLVIPGLTLIVTPPKKVVPGSLEKPAISVIVPAGLLMSALVAPAVLVAVKLEPVDTLANSFHRGPVVFGEPVSV